MGEMSEFFTAWKEHKKERKRLLGIPCPECKIKLSKAQPKILMPNQKCWCGFVYKQAREIK